MSNKCRNLGLIVLILGIIGSCIMAYTIGKNISEIGWIIGGVILVGGCFSSYVGFVRLEATAEILDNQDIIFQAISNLTEEVADADKVPQGYWKCTCGNLNPVNTGTCGCGKRNPAL